MNKTMTDQKHRDEEHMKDVNFEIDKMNSRLLVKDSGEVKEETPPCLIELAKEKALGKIIVTCRKENHDAFEASGFQPRARVKGLFRGEDGYFLTTFIDSQREKSLRQKQEDKIIEKCMEKESEYKPPQKKFVIKTCEESDIPQMIDLFKTVFESYPTKVYDPAYLKEVMRERILFKAIVEDGKIISMASADRDRANLNAEITDCATYPSQRGRGLLPIIITSLEQDLREQGFITAYSLARAINTGINMVLRKLGYEYNGRLINNCNICGRYEDMNIWSKTLSLSSPDSKGKTE